MNTTNSIRGKTLLLILMAFFILGASSPRPNSGIEVGAWNTLSVPANHCFSIDPAYDPSYSPEYAKCDSLECAFLCPVRFPTTLDVRIRRFIMVAYDNSSGVNIGYLWRGKPAFGTASLQAAVASSNSVNDPQKHIDATIDNGNVLPSDGSFIVLSIQGSDTKVYGFTIKYSILP